MGLIITHLLLKSTTNRISNGWIRLLNIDFFKEKKQQKLLEYCGTQNCPHWQSLYNLEQPFPRQRRFYDDPAVTHDSEFDAEKWTNTIKL